MTGSCPESDCPYTVNTAGNLSSSCTYLNAIQRRSIRKWRYQSSGRIISSANESKQSASAVDLPTRKPSRAIWIGELLRVKFGPVAMNKRTLGFE